MFKGFKFFVICDNVPNCTICGGSDTIDNGDGYYCYDCNTVFRNF